MSVAENRVYRKKNLRQFDMVFDENLHEPRQH